MVSRLTLVLVPLLGAAADVMAQAQPLPGTVQPGQIERQFQPLPEPRVQPSEVVVPAPAQAAPANAAEIKFALSAVLVEGVSVYPEQALRPFYEAHLNRQVSLADIYAVANALTAKYRNDGYILSQVVVPAQEVRQGTIRLQAIEGYVHEVRIEGEIEGRRDLVESCASKIERARPLTAATLERYLLLMNDFAGATARATLRASEQPGASDLIVMFSHRTASAGVSLDNRGSKALGPQRLIADLELNSLFGRYERTSVKLGSSLNKELAYASLAHEHPVGSEGGRLTASYTSVRAEPTLTSAVPINVETSSQSGSVGYLHPLRRGRSRNLYLRGGLSFHNGVTDLDGARSSDRIRAFRLGLTYDRVDALRGINIVDVELGQGIDGLGATRSGSARLSRASGRSDFTKLLAYGARLQSIAGGWSMLAALNAQYAFSDLLAPELFSFGGEQFGRGYDPSELVGDSGASMKLELRYTGAPAGTLPTGYTAYGFYDAGTVRRRTPVNQTASESATSAGVGMRFSIGRFVSGFVEVAKPLTHVVAAEGNRDLRGYFGIAARY